MALKKKPVNGMKDILPREMAVRDYVTRIITDTYNSFGFTHIETPVVEEIENLTSKQGGENEKLIFKILKRGEKLDVSGAESEADIVDYGLRYDLTLPLSRFYSNNENDLPQPFKALQMGPVFRADRPQRGRYRQFTQCDIDILGEPSNLAETELILATATTLANIGFSGFEIHISDRRLLHTLVFSCGFPDESFDDICVILDKMDKIGLEGVAQELREKDFDGACVDRLSDIFTGLSKDSEGLKVLSKKLGEEAAGPVNNLLTIMKNVDASKTADFTLVFDPTLVRGMGYYTGTIFEIIMPEFGAACGGGGRYDGLIGRFTGKDTPACGFSIGFERIVLLLLERDMKIPGEHTQKAYLIEKGCSDDQLTEILKKADAGRKAGHRVLVTRMNKNRKFQKEKLSAEGYEEITEVFKGSPSEGVSQIINQRY